MQFRRRATTRQGPGRFAVSAVAERSQHQGGEIVAGGPGSIKILWLTPAKAHLPGEGW